MVSYMRAHFAPFAPAWNEVGVEGKVYKEEIVVTVLWYVTMGASKKFVEAAVFKKKIRSFATSRVTIGCLYVVSVFWSRK
jgi:hypothetical protein